MVKQFILLGSRSQVNKCTTEVVDVNGIEVPRSESIHYLGVWIEQYMSLKRHITNKCPTAMLSFQRIKLIRRYLTKDATTTLLLGLVISHLDYCNLIYMASQTVTSINFREYKI